MVHDLAGQLCLFGGVDFYSGQDTNLRSPISSSGVISGGGRFEKLIKLTQGYINGCTVADERVARGTAESSSECL